MRNIEYSYEDAEKKSKKFLKDILGQELYDKFIKDGKIEIRSGKNVYELYLDERVINKTTNQKYCIVPDRHDYPRFDILAIKYAWLKYGINTVEKVANKTVLRATTERTGVDRTIGYDAFVHYMEERGWFREKLTIDESNTSLITTYSVDAGYCGHVVDIRCPTGLQMTMMGTQQVPYGGDRTTAHSLALRITDKDEKEISGYTKIRIEKIKPSEDVIQLTRVFYADLSLTRTNSSIMSYKTSDELYRFIMGIMLHGEEFLRINVINSDTTIPSNNVKIRMNCDLWTRRV